MPCKRPASATCPSAWPDPIFALDRSRLDGAAEKLRRPLRDVMVSAGAGFVVVLTGDIMTMPGLPKDPAAESIDIDAQGQIVGLF